MLFGASWLSTGHRGFSAILAQLVARARPPITTENTPEALILFPSINGVGEMDSRNRRENPTGMAPLDADFRMVELNETSGRSILITITMSIGRQKIATPLERAAIPKERALFLTNTTPNLDQLAWVWIEATCFAGELNLPKFAAKMRNENIHTELLPDIRSETLCDAPIKGARRNPATKNEHSG